MAPLWAGLVWWKCGQVTDVRKECERLLSNDAYIPLTHNKLEMDMRKRNPLLAGGDATSDSHMPSDGNVFSLKPHPNHSYRLFSWSRIWRSLHLARK